MNHMRTITSTAAVMLFAASTSVLAEPANTGWSGFYAGAHGGYGWSTMTVNGENKEDMDLKGGLGGLHAGYLWQWQKVVAGVEGDFSWSGLDWTKQHKDGAEVGGVTVENDWLASIRARLGYDLGPALLYGTAGVAWTDWSVDSKFHDLGTGETNHFTGGSTGTGWVIGGGGEVKLTEHVLARIEALHYRIDDLDVDGKVNGVPTDDGATTVDQKITVVRGGLSWRF